MLSLLAKLHSMWNPFKRKTEDVPSWDITQLEIEQASLVWKQEMSGRNIDHQARMEGLDMFEQYRTDIRESAHLPPPFNRGCGLYIPKPRICMITEYPGQKSKWCTNTYREAVLEEFHRLKDFWDKRLTTDFA